MVHVCRYCVCSSSLLQDLAVGCLWEPKVHQLVEQLIDDHKVVLNALLLQFLEVLCKHLQVNILENYQPLVAPIHLALFQKVHINHLPVKILIRSLYVALTSTILYKNE